MNARRIRGLAFIAAALFLHAPLAHAFVQRRTASGAPCHWRNPGAVAYVVDRVGSRDIPTDGGRDQVRLAFAWWSMDPHSTLRMTATPGPAQDRAIAQDGLNAVAWIEDPSFEGLAMDVLGSTRMYVDAHTGEIYEADIWLNGVSFTWSPLWSDTPRGASGPAHVQAVLTHLIGLLVGLDHSVDRDATLFPVLPIGPSVGIHIRPDEESAVRTLYPASNAPADAVVSGRVARSAGPIEGAYVTAHETGTGASYGAITDASGRYALHLPSSGSYRVRAQPYTTDPRITLSPYYRALRPSNLDFLAIEHPVSIAVSAGQGVEHLDFTVSASGSLDDPYEPDGAPGLARPIATDGTRQLHHAWTAGESPAYDEDWTSFVSQPGHLYIIDTDRTGHSIAAFGAATPELARTRLRLQAGSVLLAENDSRDPWVADPRSRIAFFERQGSRMLTLRASMRDADAVGAGYYYDLSVTDLAPPLPQPRIDAALPSTGPSAGGYVIALYGSGFTPGSRVSMDGGPDLVASVDDCDPGYSCATIKVVVPEHAPMTVDLVVTGPDGATATLAGGFTYLAPLAGSYKDAWADAFGALTPSYLGYGQAICFGDYDNDGWVDLFRGANPPAGYGGNRLLRNHWGAFTDVTDQAFGSLPSFITSCAWGDYDNDGWLDLVVVNHAGANALYHNARDGTFSAAWLGSSGGLDATWLDFNHDGCLDLFVAQAFPDGNNELWRGQCNGSFVNVASSLGLAVNRHTTRIAIRDFNGDGWDDIYLANWSGVADSLYFNQKGSSFVDATIASGIVETRECADVESADLNGDGFADIVCSGDTRGTNDTLKPPLWLNDGGGRFTNIAQAAGLWNAQRYCNAATVFDRDNDGIEDVYFGCERASFPPHTGEDLDLLLSNDGAAPPTLTDVTVDAGIQEYLFPRGAWATAVADVDSDGDNDIYVTGSTEAFTGIVPDDSDYFWRNTTNAPWELSPARDWIKIRLRGGMRPGGTAQLSPARGEGAQVTVVYDFKKAGGALPTEGECLRRPLPAGARAITRELVGGSHGQSSLELLFGLGAPRPADVRYVDCVIVAWPSGLRRAYTRLAVNSYVELPESAPFLELLSVTPATGPVTGATELRLAGFNFTAGATVDLDGTPALDVSVVSDRLITCAAPAHPAGVVDVTVVNPDGVADTLVDAYAYVLPVGSIEVVDPNPSMLDGPAVSSNPAVLAASAARGVFGFAADGVTPVVVRLPVPSAGIVDFAVYDEARRTTNIGALRAPNSTSSGPTLTVSTNQVGAHHMGLAILTAPGWFRRDAADDPAPWRTVTIEATFHPATGGATHVSSMFFIVRPPVLLLHGIWSDASTWGWQLRNDLRFVVDAHDYAATSDRSFWDNRWVPARGAREALAHLRERGLAGTQVAVFGHSMGGLLSRIHASGQRTDYARDDNFGAGDFYSLVTVDTAHAGSPLADFGMLLRDHSQFGRNLELVMDLLGMNIRNGAAWDLQSASYETTHFPAVDLPAHAFVAVGGSDLIESGIGIAAATPRLKLALALFETFGFDLQAGFPERMQHDLVVGRESQEGGIDRTTLFRYVDAENKAIHFDSMTRESIPNQSAIDLMNTSITDASVWASGFPGGPQGIVTREEETMRSRGRSQAIAAGLLAGAVALPAAHAVTITSPLPSSVFRQGESVVVTAQPASGFVPLRMAFFVTDSDAVVVRAAPWTATLQISQEVVGPSTIRVVAVGAGEASDIVEIPIRVAAAGAELLGMSVGPEEVLLFEGKQREQLRVTGQFSDGISRRMTSPATGTTYDSHDASVATVSDSGSVTGHAIGSTTIVVRNGSVHAAVPVRVESVPMALMFSSKTSLAWPHKPDALGYDVVSGSLGQLRTSGGNFATSVTGCVARGIPATTASVSANPTLGNGFFYLLRYRRPGSPASYDEFPDWMGNQVGKRDAEVAASAGVCAP